MPKKTKKTTRSTPKHCSTCGKVGVYSRTHRAKSKGGHVG